MPKFHPQPDACGNVDEISSTLALAKSLSDSDWIKALATDIQRDLYNLMAELAATKENAEKFRKIDSSRVNWLESQIDEISTDIEIPNEFVIPGDSLVGAAFDMVRTVTRRAERAVSKLHLDGTLQNPYLLPYLNRLSSLCFVLSLWENKRAGFSTPTIAKDTPE